ncbi:MAG: hypothetical protein WC670_09890 [Pseudolabrys sp.]
MFPHIGDHRPNDTHRFDESGGGQADFPHPVAHFSRSADVDPVLARRAEQAAIATGNHCITAGTTAKTTTAAGITDGGTSQADICASMLKARNCGFCGNNFLKKQFAQPVRLSAAIYYPTKWRSVSWKQP